ncbi:MAG: hypothetical protein CL764_04540 [Chloroflexi bacterium]|nr:hypothetical protein [Chloroflexota bacterium]|tara:strand:+ start:910 stop:1200 length:291 start_codon:yes stop_codon:yes gene_type:complete
MDPNTLNIADWLMRLTALRILWICLLLAPAAAGSLLIAHAIIPSAVDSHHISRKWVIIRAPLYLFGFGTLFIEIILFIYAFYNMTFLSDLYPRFWQ